MSRFNRKVDGNQAEIARALQEVGATVQSLAKVGDGCPDLLVGYEFKNFILEIKDPTSARGKRGLNERQRAWHDEWRGQVAEVSSPEEALFAIGYR